MPRLRPARPWSGSACPCWPPSTTPSPSTAASRWSTPRPRGSASPRAAGTPSPRCRPGSPSRMTRIITVSQNSIERHRHRPRRSTVERLHVVPVGVDQDLFRPLARRRAHPRPPHHHRQRRRHHEGPALPARGRGQAAHRAPRRAGRHRPPEGGRPVRPAPSTSSACATPSSSSPACPKQRIIELYTEAEVAVVPSLYEGFSLPAIEAMSLRRAPRRHHRRRPARGRRQRRRDRPRRAPGRQRGPRRQDRPGPRRPRAAGPHRRRRPPAGASTAGPGATPPSAPSSSTGPCSPRPPTSRPAGPAAPGQRPPLPARGPGQPRRTADPC